MSVWVKGDNTCKVPNTVSQQMAANDDYNDENQNPFQDLLGLPHQAPNNQSSCLWLFIPTPAPPSLPAPYAFNLPNHTPPSDGPPVLQLHASAPVLCLESFSSLGSLVSHA